MHGVLTPTHPLQNMPLPGGLMWLKVPQIRTPVWTKACIHLQKSLNLAASGVMLTPMAGQKLHEQRVIHCSTL